MNKYFKSNNNITTSTSDSVSGLIIDKVRLKMKIFLTHLKNPVILISEVKGDKI